MNLFTTISGASFVTPAQQIANLTADYQNILANSAGRLLSANERLFLQRAVDQGSALVSAGPGVGVAGEAWSNFRSLLRQSQQKLAIAGVGTATKLAQALTAQPRTPQLVHVVTDLPGATPAPAPPPPSAVYAEPPVSMWDRYKGWVIAGGIVLAAGTTVYLIFGRG